VAPFNSSWTNSAIAYTTLQVWSGTVEIYYYCANRCSVSVAIINIVEDGLHEHVGGWSFP